MVNRRTSIGLLVGLPATLLAHLDTGEATAVGDAERRENCAFLQDVRKVMREAIERGELDLLAERVVRCPLCSQHLQVTLLKSKSLSS